MIRCRQVAMDLAETGFIGCIIIAANIITVHMGYITLSLEALAVIID